MPTRAIPELVAERDALLTVGGLTLTPPVVELDGVVVTCAATSLRDVSRRTLANGVTERNVEGAVLDQPGLTLRVTLRTAADDPVARFRYTLLSERPRRMTKSAGQDHLIYFGTSLRDFPAATEVRFSEFRETVHSYCLAENEIRPSAFEHGLAVMGPMLVAGGGGRTVLLAYEHGSTAPDAFLRYSLSPGRDVRLEAVKGNYWHGRVIGPGQAFESIWFQIATIEGDLTDMARAYRRFVLEHMSVNTESRKPYIYYNTWNYQERNKHWNGKPYLESMTQGRILAEIDVAHRMGIDVFVIDTGWYEKTGDWRVNTQRFPDGLKAVKQKLDDYGMKLGLWFDNAAAMSSRMRQGHDDCVISWKGDRSRPAPIWETEDSQRMCLASRYADAFADEWIRLARELGVRYFKWDAIGQYGCDDPGHDHGTADNDHAERADCYAFELGRAMIRIVERLNQAVPDAIVDFDITESGRFVGLGFLAAGKYFLINNGPYYHNYDVPIPPPGNWNLFFWPGLARTWICREPLSFDRWIPSILYLTHYFPDDPQRLQTNGVASLILGHNGIWGDLLNVSDAGVGHIRRLLDLYKQVRDDITRADPVRFGAVGGSPEIHEKIDPGTGKGCICLFAAAKGTYHYVSHNRVAPTHTITEGGEVTLDPQGRAKLTVTMPEPGACIAFFGV